MRLTAVILIASLLQVSAATFGQRITLNQKKASLEAILTEIRTQSGYDFYYDSKLLSSTKPFDIFVQDVSIEDALDATLSGLNIKYLIKGKTVIFQKKESSFLNKLVEIFKDVTISGKVVNELGSPMAGVSVKIKGSTKGTFTDSQGRFALQGVDENAVLTFHFVGYASKQINASEATGPELIIKLVPSEMALDEVVAVGYGTARRKDLTGSVSSINMKEVKDAPFATLDQALAGKASGVQVVQSDGSPGGVARIRIRGGASLIGGNDPLYIIDGVPVQVQNSYIQTARDVRNPIEGAGADGALANGSIGGAFTRALNTLGSLNINDIETIDILKDASATAIYGSRAANGVVIITTKKGTLNQKPTLEANYYTAASTAITQDLLNAAQYKALLKEGATNLQAILAQRGAPANAVATSILNDSYFANNSSNTDWLDFVTRTGITQNANVDVRGGGLGSRYYTSLNYSKQTGTLKGTDFMSVSGKVNLDNSFTDRARLITNINYGYRVNNVTSSVYPSALFVPPTYSPYNADGSLSNFLTTSFGAGSLSGIQNPNVLLQSTNKGTTASVIGSLSFEYDILKTLKFKSTASINYSNYHQDNYIPSSVNVATGTAVGGVATQGQTVSSDVFYENTLTWNQTLGKDHRFTVLGGTSWQKSSNRSFTASGQGFPDDKYLTDLSSAAITLPATQASNQYALLSFYLRANYALKEKYLITATVRSDASSKFSAAHRVGYFPSAGIAWRMKEESFLKNVSWLNELKIRIGAGYTGTQNLGNNLFYTLYTPTTYAQTNALIPTQLGNDRLKWESTLQKDAGLDFEMFNSRLTGSFAYYEKRATGLLMAQNVATSSGYQSAFVNFASIQNRGLELNLRAQAVKGKNFSWIVEGNISGNRSKVLGINKDFTNPNTTTTYTDPYLINAFTTGNTILRVGEPVGLIFGYVYQGVLRTQQEVDNYKPYSTLTSLILPNLGIGDAHYLQESEGIYKGALARRVIGHAEPKFYGGVTNTFNYKNFGLTTLFSFSYGGDLLYLPKLKSFGIGDQGNRETSILDHYSADNTQSNNPRIVLGESQVTGVTATSAAVFDASYLKLKTITLSYQLPAGLLQKLRIRNAYVYASGNNLFIWSKYPGPDPETSNDPYSLIGGYTDNATYPSMRQYSLGLRLGF